MSRKDHRQDGETSPQYCTIAVSHLRGISTQLRRLAERAQDTGDRADLHAIAEELYNKTLTSSDKVPP